MISTSPPGPARAALIIPARNEAVVIGHTLARVPRELFASVIVADDGSTDGTAAVARAAGAEVVLGPKQGYGAACLRTLAALPAGLEAAVFLQADGSEDPNEARRLLAPICEGRADLVIGSRTLGGAEKGALHWHQVLGNRFSAWLIRLFFGRRYSDLSPFRAIRLSALASLRMRERGYGWTVEMQVKALQHGLRVLEVPVSYRVRVAGASKVSGNWRGSLNAGARIIWTIVRLALAGRKQAQP